MGYMTFRQQVDQHLRFLRKAGLELESLAMDSNEFIRSLATGETGRREYAYKTVSRRLNNGMLGLMSWCRSENGQVNTYKTYGYPSTQDENRLSNLSSLGSSKNNLCSMVDDRPCFDADVEKIRKFWELSSLNGESDYLRRKRVGAYNIRFRENQYGKVAIIPIRDAQGHLWGYQILNSNGSKVFARGTRLAGMYHCLMGLVDGMPIGIAESYATAASCLELSGIPMVTAFTSDNLASVVIALERQYPSSSLVIFADNDRHLHENKGVICATLALKQVKSAGIVLTPWFHDYPCTHEYSDWNDLVRELGSEEALKQLQNGLKWARREDVDK